MNLVCGSCHASEEKRQRGANGVSGHAVESTDVGAFDGLV